MVEDSAEHYTVYADPKRDPTAEAARQVLRDFRLQTGQEARKPGVPKSTFHAAVAGRPMSVATRAILVPLAARYARKGLREGEALRAPPEHNGRALYAYLRELDPS